MSYGIQPRLSYHSFSGALTVDFVDKEGNASQGAKEIDKVADGDVTITSEFCTPVSASLQRASFFKG